MIQYILYTIGIVFFLVAGSDKEMTISQKITSYAIITLLFFLLSKVVILNVKV